MTRQEIEDILLTSLGSGRVNVEVDPVHINSAITLGLLWLSTYAPRQYSINITTLEGQSKIDLSNLPSDIIIFEVNRSKNATAFASYNLENFEVFMHKFDVVDLAILQNYIETINKQIGKEFSWRFEYPFLYLNQPLTAGEVLEVKYIKPYQSVEEIPIKFLPSFIKYVKAELKEILGRIRGKYKGVPAPEGIIEMDHSELLSESQTEKQEALEELKKIQPASMFIVG